MPTYLHPGVYIEEIASAARPIGAVGTSTALFVGYATKGPVGEPTLLFTWGQYEKAFGGINNFYGRTPDVDYMGHTVQAFFSNGGGKAYVVRLATGAAPAGAKLVIPPATASNLADIENYLNIKAANPGAWANGIELSLKVRDAAASPQVYTLEIGRRDGNGTLVVEEKFDRVTLVEDDKAFVAGIVNDASELVTVDPVDFQDLTDADKQPFYIGSLTSGDLSRLTPSQIQALDQKELSVTLDSNVSGNDASNVGIEVTLDASSGLSTLDHVASQIASGVRAGTNTDAKSEFACVAEGGRLVLTSGTTLPESSVTIGAAPKDAAAPLLLDTATAANGVLTSGDLSGVTAQQIQALDGAHLKVTLDGGANPLNLNIDVRLNAPSSLANVASQVQGGVRGTGTVPPARATFTCVVNANTLVLTSGTAGQTGSNVTVAAAPADAASSLKLLSVAGSGDTATALTGEASFLATFALSSSATLDDGGDGSRPVSVGDYGPVFEKLRKFRDINIAMIPDHQWGADASKAIIDVARMHAEFMKSHMLLIDPPAGTRLVSENDVAGLGLPASTYTALYYPWVETVNPHYHPELRSYLEQTYFVPPSGFAAGIWAKTDGRRGVWKAPAGVATGLIGAVRTEFKVGNDEQDQLNPVGVNCYRTILSEPVIWGSRTLATRADPEWRYVPIRRTAMMIEESVFQGIQWAVFEPNDHNLWASIRLNIGTFMDGLHRAGAFQGAKASDAYFVNCGLGDTMTQGDIDAGRVIAVVGFAPLKPAEFVIIRIQQKVAQQ